VIAQALAGEGFAVSLAARTRSELEETAAEIEAGGGRTLVRPADATRREQVEALVGETEEALGPIELLVSNAGSARALGPAWEVEPDAWWADVETNLRSAFLCAHAVLPRMISRGHGRVLHVSSYVAARPSPYLSAYAAAKAAIVSFSEGLAAAAEPHGVRVFTITPGLFRSALVDHLMSSVEGRRWLPEVGEGRWVEPEQVARLVTFLASGAGDALAGRFLHALDDVEDLMRRADEIAEEDLFTVRLRR